VSNKIFKRGVALYMNSLVKIVPNVKKYNDYLFNVNKGTNPIMLSGLTDTAKVHLAYSTKFYVEKPICIITYNEMQARKLIKDMQFFKEEIKFFKKKDITSFDFIAESKDELYDRITEAANTATLFKQNRESLAKLITSLQEGDIIALSPLQIAQLLINVSEEDKPLFSEEDKEIINDLAKTQQVYKAEEAKAILSFLEMKRLSTRENTDLYNRVINSLEHNCEYEPLFIEEGQLIRVSEENKKEIKTPIKKIELNNDNNKRTRKI
jgi:hypothetical protein